MENLRVLISREQIAARVAELGAQISRDFAGESIVLVGVLKGAAIFLSDLARAITLDAGIEFVAVASYGAGTESGGIVRLVKDLDRAVAGENVLLVEDILDSGITINYLVGLLASRLPKCVKTVVLLDKPSRRIEPREADYVGFEIPGEFVVGYGLDFAERYRNLPDVCVLERGSRR